MAAHNAFRYMGTNAHKKIPAFAKKNLRARIKVACVELFRGACAAICCDCDLWKPRSQDTEEVSALQIEKSKAKEQFYDSILDALRDLHTSKC